jgi:hypothetical protein
MAAKAKTRTGKKPETHESPKRESPATEEQKQLDRELDRELADSFPASDPPSVTQPTVKSGAPERKPSSRK